MVEARTALARLFVLMAIVTVPKSMRGIIRDMFCISDELKSIRDGQKAEKIW